MTFAALDPTLSMLIQNGAFFALASLYVAIGARRAAGTAAFPGPRPPAAWFKAWLLVIWGVGLLLPLAVLVYEGAVRGAPAVGAVLGGYLIMVVAQIATEIFVWKRWRSPIWVIVPCLYLPWRLWQVAWGMMVIEPATAPLTALLLPALGVMWIVNIGVHFTNVPMTLRWDYHPKSATFPSLHDPAVLTRNAHDPPDPQSGAKTL